MTVFDVSSENDNETLGRAQPLMEDVAARAGVSLATVDRVLNQRKGVRHRTASLVLSAAMEIGYLNEADYKNLASPRPPNIIFLLPNGTNPYLRLLGDKVRLLAENTSRDIGNIRCFFIDSFDPEAFAAALRHHSKWADAIACMALDHPGVREVTAELVHRGKRIVSIVSDFAPAVRTAYVGLDNQAAGRTAAYLLGRFSAGRKGSVAVIAGSRIYRAHTEREMGFQSLMEEMFPQLQPVGVREGHDDRDENYRHALSILDQYPGLVGIYNAGGSTDGIARALRERGRSSDTILIGHGLSPDTRRLLLDGTMDAVVNSEPDALIAAAINACRPSSSGFIHTIKMDIFFRENLPTA